MTEPPSYPGTPRWVKTFGVVAIGLVLLFVLTLWAGFGGPHGPGRHVLNDESLGRMPDSARSDPAGSRP